MLATFVACAETPKTDRPLVNTFPPPRSADSPSGSSNAATVAASPQAKQETPATAVWTSLEGLLFSQRPAWRQWGEQHLQTGDLVFTRGNYYILLGMLNFTDISTQICQSEFSHVGIVAVEEGVPMVYDVSNRGVDKLPFGHYVTQSGFQRVTIKRPDPSLYQALPATLEFVRRQASEGKQFDHRFEMGSDKFYCTELIAAAFSEAGVELCQPTLVSQLPGRATANPVSVELLKRLTGLQEHTAIYCIGNSNYGLIGNPLLREILPPTEIGWGAGKRPAESQISRFGM